MNIRLALLCALISLPLTGADQTTSPIEAAFKLTDFAIVAVRPRILVVTVRCGRDETPSRTVNTASVRDQDGVTQSQGFSPRLCNGQPSEILLDIPDGAGGRQKSEVLFTVSSPAKGIANR